MPLCWLFLRGITDVSAKVNKLLHLWSFPVKMTLTVAVLVLATLGEGTQIEKT